MDEHGVFAKRVGTPNDSIKLLQMITHYVCSAISKPSLGSCLRSVLYGFKTFASHLSVLC